MELSAVGSKGATFDGEKVGVGGVPARTRFNGVIGCEGLCIDTVWDELASSFAHSGGCRERPT